MEIKIYRHKEYKDIFLKRNTHICGGSCEANFFEATKDLLEALSSFRGKNIEEEFKDFFYDYKTKKSELKAKISVTKEVEDYDGFKGKLTKELVLPLNDFELITLVEVQNE